jgi:mono/diheme cytochrome c family protein
MQTTIPRMTKGLSHFTRRTKSKTFLALIVGAASLSGVGVATADGEAIFNQRCAACHSIGGGRLVGPDLKAVHTKRSQDWLIKITKSAKGLIDSGDAEAKKLLDEYKMMMPDQDLSDADVKVVLDYIASKGS